MSASTAPALYEPALTIVRLRGCSVCGCRHPLAFDPPVDQDECPQCGAKVLMPDSEQTVRAVLTGYSPAALASRAFLAVGRVLHRLADRI